MATSGTSAYDLDIVDLIEDAYERVYGEPVTLTGHHMRTALRSLRLLMTEWSGMQLNLWTIDQQQFTVTQGTQTYDLDAVAGTAGTIDVVTMSIRRDGTDTELTRISRSDFELLPDKDDQGKPSQAYIDKRTSSVVMYLWQVPENSTDVIRYWRIRRIEEPTAHTQDPDVPKHFLEAMTAGLAYKLSFKSKPGGNPLPPNDKMLLRKEYDDALNAARNMDRDRTPIQMVPYDYVRRLR